MLTIQEIHDPNLHNYGGKRAYHLAVSDNGSYLICGLNDGSAVLWDLDNDALCYTYKGHSLEVRIYYELTLWINLKGQSSHGAVSRQGHYESFLAKHSDDHMIYLCSA